MCAHALALDDILVIPDLTQDPRTRENTLVTREPHIRFYVVLFSEPQRANCSGCCV
jgi:GAF domain-containing protein